MCENLRALTEELSSRDSEGGLLSFDLDHIINGGLSASETERIKRTGCFIVRQVVPEDMARQQYQVLRQYIGDNKAQVKGWPAESPSMLMLYDSPPQIAIRTHPNMLRLQRKLNDLWHDASNETSPTPLLYSDGMRDRPPHSPFMGLGPHIDAGSFSRWADPTYRHAYHEIFRGQPDQHDCYNLEARKDADQYLFPAQAHSRVFRSFQGWTALTPAAPRAGSLMLYPHVQNTIAYLLLRPFFDPPIDGSDILDASKWTFNPDGAWFPGTFKEQSQLLSRSSHPHLRLEECLISAPPMHPGDSIWWHTDVRYSFSSLVSFFSADKTLGRPRRRHRAPGHRERVGRLYPRLSNHRHQQDIRQVPTRGITGREATSRLRHRRVAAGRENLHRLHGV